MSGISELTAAPMAAQIFGNAGREYMEKHGVEQKHFAMVLFRPLPHQSISYDNQSIGLIWFFFFCLFVCFRLPRRTIAIQPTTRTRSSGICTPSSRYMMEL